MCSLIKQDKTKNGALPLPVFLAFFSLVTTASGFSNSFIPAFLVSLQLPGYMFGLVYAIASFMIFILSPFWGKLSERIGRTRVIAAGCLGAACGQALFCTATVRLKLFLRAVSRASLRRVFCGVSLVWWGSVQSPGQQCADGVQCCCRRNFRCFCIPVRRFGRI